MNEEIAFILYDVSPGILSNQTYKFIDKLGSESCYRQGGVRVTKIHRSDAMGNVQTTTLNYGHGHVSCIPPYMIPELPDFVVESPYHIDLLRNEFRVVNRGGRGVYYESITFTNANSSETIHYSIGYPMNTQIYRGPGSLIWTYHTNNTHLLWGLPIKRTLNKNGLIDEFTYEYETVFYKYLNVMFADLGVPGNIFYTYQYFPNLKKKTELHYQESNPSTKQEKEQEFLYGTDGNKAKQLKKKYVRIGEKEWETKITYAHEIDEYGGTTYNPDNLDKMRLKNNLKKIAQVDEFFKIDDVSPSYLINSNITTYKEVDKWPQVINVNYNFLSTTIKIPEV